MISPAMMTIANDAMIKGNASIALVVEERE
jgi:hypothetical protein